MSHGAKDWRRGKRDRALRDNSARIGVAWFRLECGHDVQATPAVTTPGKKPDLFVCPYGCGLKKGRRRP